MDLDETVENVKVKMLEHMSLLASQNAPTKKMTMTVNNFDIYNGVQKMVTKDTLRDYHHEGDDSISVFIVLNLEGGGRTPNVMRTINKDKADKKTFLHKVHQDMFDKVKSKVFDCGTLKDAQAVVTHISSFAGHPSLLFSQAIEPLNMDDLKKMKHLMEDNTGNAGSTEARIEKVARWVMGKHFRALDVVSQDVDNLETCLVLSMVKI